MATGHPIFLGTLLPLQSEMVSPLPIERTPTSDEKTPLTTMQWSQDPWRHYLLLSWQDAGCRACLSSGMVRVSRARLSWKALFLQVLRTDQQSFPGEAPHPGKVLLFLSALSSKSEKRTQARKKT